MNRITIGKLATNAGVGIDTVRFYERAGLMPRPARTAAGYRLYAAADVDRMRFIRRAKALGFALDEIAELLGLSAGRGGREGVKALAERRLLELEGRIRELTVMRDALAGYASRCSGKGPVQGCPIIEAVLAGPRQESTPPCVTHGSRSTTTKTRPRPATRRPAAAENPAAPAPRPAR